MFFSEFCVHSYRDFTLICISHCAL